MKKEIKNASVEAVEAYEAPKCEVMELQAEGALLQSSERPLPPGFEGDDGYHEEDENSKSRSRRW